MFSECVRVEGVCNWLEKVAKKMVVAIFGILLAGGASVAHAAIGPWIKIDSPANGASFTAPASVSINVSAGSTVPGQSVSAVYVYVNDELIYNNATLSNLPAGTYYIYATANFYTGEQMLDEPVEASGWFTVTGPPPRNAQFLSQSVPSTMVVGQTYNVNVQMKNTGAETWTAAASYRLGTQNPENNGVWNIARVDVPSGIGNGQTANFGFAAKAPLTAGTYNFQWKMLQEGVAWFGDATPNQAITVQASTIYGNIDGIGNGMLLGWACSTRLNQSIDVHLYVGGPAGTGTGVGAYTANRNSEPGVAAACLAGGSAYRFEIPITQQMVTQHGGKSIYVHGISPVGAANLTIAGSGAYNIPPNQPPAVSMISPANGANFNVPATFAMQATASDIDDGIAQVTFYVDDQPVYTASTGPFQYPIRELVAGTHTYHAVAQDTRGAITTSAKVSVTATQSPWTPPMIPPGPITKREYVYDQHQRLCKIIEPETGATVMDYDGADNVQWSASGLDLPNTASCDTLVARDSGRKVTRYYDQRNRLTTLEFPNGRGNQTWTYEEDGLPATISTHNVSGGDTVINAYAYNKRRLLTGESVHQPGWYTWPLSYGYDAIGNLASHSYPTGLIISYLPNALGQPREVRDHTNYAYATGLQYYPNGAIKRFTYGNGIVHTMDQNERQLPRRSTDSGGALDLAYTFDANANVDSILDHAQDSGNGFFGRWMTYDGLDRLTAAGSCSFGGDCWHRFTYNKLDNLTSWKLPGVKDYAEYVYGAKNQLTNIKDSAGATIVGFDYDEQGNLRNKNGQIYQFDFGNRLREVNGKEWFYRYDGYGRRVLTGRADGITVSQYNHSGQLMYQEQTGKGNFEHIYLGGSLVASRNSGVVKYQHTDALGSPVAVTDAAAVVTDRTSYEPYGAAINEPAYDGIGYTGHVMDGATGLTYMQQRYMDPGIGRFLSVDPVTAYGSGDMRHFNVYDYAYNNPYKFTDPDGRAGEREFNWENQRLGTKPPPRSDKDWLGPVLGYALAGVLAAPVVAELSFVAMAHPGATVTATEVLAGAAGVTGATTSAAVAMKGFINPNLVRFSQSSVKGTFTGGGGVQAMADALKSGALKASDVPAIRLVERAGKLFTLDNRRLEAFRRAGVDAPYRMATPREAANEAWKFTTKNEGASTRVRGE